MTANFETAHTFMEDKKGIQFQMFIWVYQAERGACSPVEHFAHTLLVLFVTFKKMLIYIH